MWQLYKIFYNLQLIDFSQKYFVYLFNVIYKNFRALLNLQINYFQKFQRSPTCQRNRVKLRTICKLKSHYSKTSEIQP